jgi:hypothetical protein
MEKKIKKLLPRYSLVSTKPKQDRTLIVVMHAFAPVDQAKQ